MVSRETINNIMELKTVTRVCSSYLSEQAAAISSGIISKSFQLIEIQSTDRAMSRHS